MTSVHQGQERTGIHFTGQASSCYELVRSLAVHALEPADVVAFRRAAATAQDLPQSGKLARGYLS